MHRRSFLAGLGALAAGCAPAASTPRVAAAADLRFALPEIAASFEAETGQQLRLIYGSTGQFAAQIRQSAPFDLFLAADESYALALAREGLTQGQGQLYARGRLALIARPESPLAQSPRLETLATLLANGQIRRFAVANPAHAPYGARAQQALESTGLWATLQPRLLIGENVAQAAQFALSPDCDGGLVALSLALAPDIAAKSRHAPVPATLHDPLNQRMVLLKSAAPAARAFHDHLLKPKARATLARYGFEPPESA
ncbi:MAG: molybdate ABC transporter substrate-binding protein [Polymorphobacter sp.]|uniref:molybdate ABC transporter substrate-binding protein n=1 Tax=Polymorphobacter sp. TaxID=1909290 RepID=UPI003A8C01F1